MKVTYEICKLLHKRSKKNYSIAMSLLLFTLNKMKIILHSLFVGHRRRAIVKNNFPSRSDTFNRFYSTDLYDISSDMEVCKRYKDIITLLSVKYDKWYSLSYYVCSFLFQIYKKRPKYNDVEPLCIFSVGLRCLHFVCRTKR